MFDGWSLGRRFAAIVQVTLAAALVASHVVTDAPYLYPHYVLLILLHPWALRRGIGLRLPPWQIGYISFALFAHPIGGLYGFYASVWWLDHLTHTLSATLVAAIGYTAARAYSFRIHQARLFVSVLTFVFVMSGGHLWEVVELHVDWLTVYSYNDTLWDYVFDAVGGLLVIALGSRTLDGGATQVAARFGLLSDAGRDSGMTPSPE